VKFNASRFWTIVLGAVLIAVLAPCAQFLTMGTLNSDMETATPVGWAVGLIFSFILIAAVMRGLAKRQVLARPNLVILYCMLTIGVPLMNLGLVRQIYFSITAVGGEYFGGTGTYRTAYNALDPDWFPVVPTREALGWAKSDRLLRSLLDPAVVRERVGAKRKLDVALAKPPVDTNALAEVTKLGPDECAALLAAGKDVPGLQEHAAALAAQSAAAAARLPAELADVDELEASLLPENVTDLDASSRLRLERELGRLPAAERSALNERLTKLRERAPALRAAVAALSRADSLKVCTALAERLSARYAPLDDAAVKQIRGSFLYRLSRAERKDLVKLDGAEGAPNLNLNAAVNSLWADQVAAQEKLRKTTWENWQAVFAKLPWRLWVGPVVLWGLLVAVVFGLVLVLADWLRHKWIERENLAFPLVEVADSLLRHDAELETAEDVREPAARKWAFSPLWWIGIAVGAVWVSLEALGHYGFAGKPVLVFLNLSADVFAQNEAFREMTHMYLVISPIVLGLAFLVSLEVSFSVWVLFLALNFVWMLCRKAGVDIRDPIYLGYGGGRLFPFWMEQFMGACLCYAVIVMVKSLGGREKSRRWLVGAGLGVALVALLWNYGMTNLAFVALIGVFVTAQTITAARVRAETGLHTQHVSYEFTKLPMVLGLTGWTGAEIYTKFIALACLPVTLLTRVLPQQLENFELARRHKVPAKTITIAAVVAFVVAVVVGGATFLLFTYYWGESVFGTGAMAGQGPANSLAVARYPLWVSHFLGEQGLDKYTNVLWNRVWFMGLGAALVGALVFLRQRFLKFPLHPLGYLIILVSICYEYITPYYKGGDTGAKEQSWLWGSVFVAWLVKKLIVKYGGMNTFKQAKPLFLGLVVGAVVAVFAWNMTDFVCSIIGHNAKMPGDFVRHFLEKPAFSPRLY